MTQRDESTIIDLARRVRGGVARRIRKLGEIAMHGSRHRTAVAMLRRIEQPKHVTVLCYGNVCRSPYLEAVLRERFARNGGAISVDSAGFVGPHRQSPDLARDCARARGLDLDPHRSRLVTDEILERADCVLVMDHGQRQRILMQFPRYRGAVIVTGDLDPKRGPRTIEDPWGRPRAVFERSFARLDRCAESLVAALSR